MPPVNSAALYATPNALALHYSRFRVAERLLLTGHSHQAWPDVGFEAQQRAWLDAAELVDRKWERAFEQADRVRRGFARLIGEDDPSLIALGASTHDLVVRFLSALALAARPRVVTTDAEFHTIRRQLDRLAEAGIEIVKVPGDRAALVAERLAAAVNHRTAGVLASSVFFHNAHIVPGLGLVQEACEQAGAALLVDVYHQLNAVPFSMEAEGLTGAFLVGGGYKYCQLGEGNCFLRVPPQCDLRPVVTGWFAEFHALESGPGPGSVAHGAGREPGTLAHAAGGGPGAVGYGAGGARFAGATYDPTSHYRAAAVFDFFEEQQLTPELLREVSQHQVDLLRSRIRALDLDPAILAVEDVPLETIGGFLALQSSRAEELARALKSRGVLCDWRGNLLRLGPAPYLTDQQLEEAVGEVGEVGKGAGGRGR